MQVGCGNTVMRASNAGGGREPPNEGIECRWGEGNHLMSASNAGGVGKNRVSRRVFGYWIDDCWSANNN